MEKIKLCSKNIASPLIRSTLVDNKIINRSEKDKIWKLNNGTGTNQIATELEARSKGGNSIAITNDKGCTKARAVYLGCSVSGSYDDNQLVKYSDLSKSVTYYTATFIANSGDLMSTFLICAGQPVQANFNRYELSIGTNTYRFMEGSGISINSESGGNTTNLRINRTGYIYPVKNNHIGSMIKSFVHKNEDYTISWTQ